MFDLQRIITVSWRRGRPGLRQRGGMVRITGFGKGVSAARIIARVHVYHRTAEHQGLGDQAPVHLGLLEYYMLLLCTKALLEYSV